MNSSDRSVKYLMDVFSGADNNPFINSSNEIILYPKTNLYFSLDNCKNKLELKCKVLEYCSRDSYKTEPFNSPSKNLKYQECIRNNINVFLGTEFDEYDMKNIYTKLGNSVHRDLTIKFIQSGYDLNVLN